MSEIQNTSHTLLQRARDTTDDEAWHRFVAHYYRFIVYILKQFGVAKDDLEDLTQQVLLGLTRNLAKYDRSRSSFRNWLGIVVRNAATSHFRKLQCRPVDLYDMDDALPFRGELQQPAEIDQLIETEWELYIANEAMARVRLAFKGQAIEAFEMGLDGRSAAEISEVTGLSVASVYTLRKRVKKRLFIEVRALTAELEA